MLNGLKPLAATALCLLGLTAFAGNAAAGQWVESGRTAYFKSGPYNSYDDHTCGPGTWVQGFPGNCASDASTGWVANYEAASTFAQHEIYDCNHNPHQLGSYCYSRVHAINGQAYAGDPPATCNVGTRAVFVLQTVETVEIQYEEIDVENALTALEYVCQ